MCIRTVVSHRSVCCTRYNSARQRVGNRHSGADLRELELERARERHGLIPQASDVPESVDVDAEDFMEVRGCEEAGRDRGGHLGRVGVVDIRWNPDYIVLPCVNQFLQRTPRH